MLRVYFYCKRSIACDRQLAALRLPPYVYSSGTLFKVVHHCLVSIDRKSKIESER